LSLGLSLGIGPIKAGVLGGFECIIGFDLDDPNDDGKVRIKELVELAKIDPRCIFVIHARFDIVITVFIKAGKEFDLEIARITVYELELTCPIPKVASFDNDPSGKSFDGGSGGDVLHLNIGPHAGERQYGNLNDGTDIVVVTQTANTRTVQITWNGTKQ